MLIFLELYRQSLVEILLDLLRDSQGPFKIELAFFIAYQEAFCVAHCFAFVQEGRFFESRNLKIYVPTLFDFAISKNNY